MSGRIVSKLYFAAAMACGEVFGRPLPPGLLPLRQNNAPDVGYRVALNTTGAAIEGVPAYNLACWRNDWPLGVVNPGGGAIVCLAEDRDAEAELIDWLTSVGGDALRDALADATEVKIVYTDEAGQ